MKLELEAQEKLIALLPCLTDKQADVVRKRYGLGMEKIWTLHEIALSIGKSSQAVFLLLKRATQRMHKKYYDELEDGKEGEFLRIMSAPDLLKMDKSVGRRKQKDARAEAALLREEVPPGLRKKFSELIQSYTVDQLAQEFEVAKKTILNIVRNFRTANKADMDKISQHLINNPEMHATPTKLPKRFRWVYVPKEILDAYKASAANVGVTGIMLASNVRRYTIERLLMRKSIKSDEVQAVIRYYESIK